MCAAVTKWERVTVVEESGANKGKKGGWTSWNILSYEQRGQRMTVSMRQLDECVVSVYCGHLRF